jgi:hypothetical protein
VIALIAVLLSGLAAKRLSFVLPNLWKDLSGIGGSKGRRYALE